MRLEDLMERAAQYDENLARDIKDYVHGRKYGLVYEASKPEFVRMWKKPVVRGDIVNILPPRGVMEDTKNEDDPSEIVYRVINISEGTATLRNEQTGDTVSAAVDDIVALARFDKPIYAGLKETGRIERGGDKPYHVVINGENYHALQTLVYVYQGQVDCIYIDPPYNSGARDWKYNNNYVGKEDEYRHSKWLTFMEDRLRLAKKLLNPQHSVLIIAIDENEIHRLAILLEQLFPAQKTQMVTVLINPAGASIIDQFSRVDEQLLFIQFGKAQPIRTYSDTTPGTSTVVDENGNAKTFTWESLLRSGGNSRREDTKAKFFPVFIDEKRKRIVGCGEHLPADIPIQESKLKPKGCIEQWPIKTNGTEACWQLSAPTFRKYLDEGRIKLGRKNKKTGRWGISFLTKGYMKAIERGDLVVLGKDANGTLIVKNAPDKHIAQKGKTMWTNIAYSATEYGSTFLQSFIPRRKFPFPKSIYAVEDALRYYIGNNKNALVLDFFGGSGTTAHAVMRLNHQDGGNRRSIIVTNNEVSIEEAKAMTQKGFRQGDKEWESLGICEYITKPRIIAATTGIDSDGKTIEGNYGVPNPSVPDPFPIANGFEENAIFFDLEYLEPSVVSADLSFDHIAPILWLAGGCKGEILKRHKGYAVGKTYAVLFDPRYKTRFVDAVLGNKEIKTVFIVTDAAERYQNLCAELPGCRVMQLYESYLRSFEINAIG